MSKTRFSRRTGLIGAASAATIAAVDTLTGSAAASAAELHLTEEVGELSLFAFDQVSIPAVQNLKLEMRNPDKHPENPVVARGGAGDPDSWAVQFYGSVIKVGDKYRMWYCAVSAEEREDHEGSTSALWRVAYAESTDGINWVKPKLGLIEFAGNTQNNLVLMDPPIGVLNLKVLYDPEDHPDRRYKMGCHVYWQNRDQRHGTLAVFSSRDGLTWSSMTDIDPINREMAVDDLLLPALHAEPVGGLYKWKDTYYASGQNGIGAVRPVHGRVGRTWESGDFVHWQQTTTMTFIRDQQHTILGPGRSLEGEQQHEGISVWNRGNVLLGLVGQWHGAASWQDVAIDLGFLISNDGLNFREPAYEWTIIERGGDGLSATLIDNASFEDLDDQQWPAPWILDANRGQTASVSTAHVRSGTRSLRVENNAGISIGVRTPKLPAEAGVEYTARLWTLTESGVPAQLYLEFYDGSGKRVGKQVIDSTASSDWSEVTASATAPAGTTSLNVMIYGATADAGVSCHDDVSISWPGSDEQGEPDWDRGGVMQGQGFENIGDETYIYYGAWDPRVNIPGVPLPPRGGVGVAVLPKDRFGDLMVDLRAEGDGDYQIPEVTSEFITATVMNQHRRPPKIYVNAEGLGSQAKLRFELLEPDFTPIPAFSGANAAILSTDGFRTPLTWRQGRGRLPEKFKIRGYFDGEQNTTIKLSALYIA